MIDPERLNQQRNVISMPARETQCSRCGRRTRDKTGTCSACRSNVPDLSKFTVERIAGLMDACRLELKRRRDELDAAMGEP